MMGDIEEKVLLPLSLSINEFCAQCKRNILFMEKFKEQVNKMELGFNSGWGSDSKLNQFFYDYEKNVLSDHLLSLNHQHKGLITKSGERPFTVHRAPTGDESTMQDQT
jgi:hypothetical protein